MVHRSPFKKHDCGRTVSKVMLVSLEVSVILQFVITNLMQSPKGNSPLPKAIAH